MTFFLFFCHFLRFLHFNHSKIQNAAGTTAQPISSDLYCSIYSQNFPVFTPLLHSCTSQFTTTTAQLPFYNCRNYHQLHMAREGSFKNVINMASTFQYL